MSSYIPAALHSCIGNHFLAIQVKLCFIIIIGINFINILEIEMFIRSKNLRVVVVGGVVVVVDFGGCKDSIRLPTVK